MKYESLRTEAFRANQRIVDAGLVLLTWGNASACDRELNLMAIKPSGVPYDQLSAETMVVVSLESGKSIDGLHAPSIDTATHIQLYRDISWARGVVHTHSHFAVVFSQAGIEIPILGTTHADHFRSAIPCTPPMTPSQVAQDYETNTGRVITETFRSQQIDPSEIPGVLVNDHGPFTWGRSVAAAVENAIALEEVARMAWHAMSLEPVLSPAPSHLIDKHFERKHGLNQYYGQKPAAGNNGDSGT